MESTPWDAIVERLAADTKLAEGRHRDTMARLAADERRAEERHRESSEFLAAEERLAEERHRALLGRGKASERVFVATLTDIDRSIQANIELMGEMKDRLDDMGETIRANTQAVLSVLDRLDP